MKFKPWLLILITILLAGIITVSWLLWLHKQNPVPLNIRQNSPFPILYPTKLPPGWSVDKKSFHSANQSIAYSINLPKTQPLVVTLQNPPDQLAKIQLEEIVADYKPFATPLGQAFISPLNAKTTPHSIIGSLYTKDTWVLISAPDGTNLNDIKNLILNLQKV